MGNRRKRQRRLDPEAHIAIIGSGLAGLAAAKSLESHGFSNVHIFERDASMSARKEGYGLTLAYNPRGVLAHLGILESMALEDCPSRSHYLFGYDGTIHGYFGNSLNETRGWGQRGNLRVPRQKVRSMLFSKLVNTKIHWGCNLVGCKTSVGDNGTIRLAFENSQLEHEIETDLLVAADGIRSSVVPLCWPAAPPAKSLGIRLILGITEGFTHGHLRERGFYTICENEGMRLFVMPFANPTGNDTESAGADEINEQYMWQLSFADDCNNRYDAVELRRQALQRCGQWHEPVPEMVCATPISSIWGTLLYERDPSALHKHMTLNKESRPRVVIIGDAFHGMSPFKGQGANQSLMDGAALGRHFTSSGIDAAVKVAQQDICQRTSPVVKASHEAAVYWHKPGVLEKSKHSFAGTVDAERAIKVLQAANVTANSVNLDEAVKNVLCEHQLITRDKGPRDPKETTATIESLHKEAVQAAAEGDLARLRRISWDHGAHILQASACIKHAMSRGRRRCADWLQTEAGCTYPDELK